MRKYLMPFLTLLPVAGLVFLVTLMPVFAFAGLPGKDAIKIGEMVWARENLDVSYYRNGDEIREAKTAAEWEKCGQQHIGCWSTYNNKYSGNGKLYNYYAVADSRGLIPYGWHVPTERELNYLILTSGGKDDCGAELKARSGWKPDARSSGINSWNGYGGGCRYSNGTFNYGRLIGYWWTANADTSTGKVEVFNLYHDRDECGINWFDKSFGFSVRCVRD